MNDKEKQIEEMAKDVHYAITKECKLNTVGNCNDCEFNVPENDGIHCQNYLVSKILAQLNYRKLPKDARVFIPTDEQYIMLSKEEYKKLNTIKAFFETYGTISTKDLYDCAQEFKEGTVKETAEKFMVLRGYITKQFHKYHEARDEAESEYKKCKEEQGKAVLNNDWHRCDAIMFILEDIATEFDKLIENIGVEIKE